MSPTSRSRTPDRAPSAANVWVMIDRAPGTISAPAAPWSSRKTTSHLEGRREAAQRRGDGEAGQPERVDPPPAVAIRQGAGQDQQGGEDRQVAADDVGLALEDADQGGRQFAADPRQGDVDDRAVEEHRAGPDDRRDEGPSLARRHRGSVADRLSALCPDLWRSSAPVSSSRDGRRSMRVCSRRPGVARPRVVILPTASYPDGEDVFQRWAAMGVAHFAALGAEVEPVLVRDRADADDPRRAQAVGEADLIYLSGGKPAPPARRAGGQRRRARRWRPPTSAARPWPAARQGRWPWPATPSTSGSASCRCRCAGGAASGSRRGSRSCRTTTRGRSRSRR